MKLSAIFALGLLALLAYVNPAASQSSYDPCSTITGSSVPKSSVAIAVTTAATTSLIAPVTGAAIYVCGFSVTISEVVTTANTMKFVYGTGATCGTGTADLTGAYGTGGVTAGIPIVLAAGGSQTLFSTPVSQRLCVTTTIGGSAAFSGVLTYVQQ